MSKNSALPRETMAFANSSSMQRMKIHIAIALLFCFGAAVVQAECPPHGCSRTTLDISAEGPLNDAMNVLRRGGGGSDDDDGDDASDPEKTKEEALSILQSTGDETALTLTLGGYKGPQPEQQINQDRALLVRPFRISSVKEDLSMVQLIGVFDGHGNGGEKTSQHALEQVPERLAKKLNSIENLIHHDNNQESESAVKQALKEVFLEVDKTDPTNGEAGCTATVILQLGSKLYIANAGDSVSFVGVYFRPKTSDGNAMEAPQQEQIQIIYETREDKPDLPEEQERILNAGGYVHIPANPNEDVPRAYHVDANGNMQWGLAMSRSLGDWYVQGVIAEPIVDVIDIREIVQNALASHADSCKDGDKENKVCEALDPSDVHIFAVSASDGMMDEVPPNYIGSVLARSLFDKGIDVHPLTAAEHLILEAAKGWQRLYNGQYRDDIAISAATVPWDLSFLTDHKL